jgi:putative nucleotidyltransferase with HDIG domain
MEGGMESRWFAEQADRGNRQAAASSVAAMAARVVMAKPFPGVATRVQCIAADPSGSVTRVARVLEGDPALCARLLRLVNSAGYALRIKCSSVRHAVALAGLDNVRDLVTSASVLKLFDAKTCQTAAVLGHCAQVGSLCRYFGAFLSLPRETLFTCGFLHDIGKLMLMEVQGDDYQALLESCADDADASQVAEQLAIGYDHAVLGAAVLTKWRIPEPVPTVVEHHHDFAGVLDRPELAQLVAVVRLADQVAHQLSRGSVKPPGSICDSPEADYLGISEPQLSAMWMDLHALCRRTRTMIDSGRTELMEGESLVPPHRSVGLNRKAEEAEHQEDVPVTYPCHVCAQATFGETCPICRAHVCPTHGGFREGWCIACADRYREVQRRSGRALPWNVAIAVGVSGALLVTASGFMTRSASMHEILGGVLLVLLAAVITATGHQSVTRTRFVRRHGRVSDGGGVGAPTSAKGLALAPRTQVPRC